MPDSWALSGKNEIVSSGMLTQGNKRYHRGKQILLRHKQLEKYKVLIHIFNIYKFQYILVSGDRNSANEIQNV